MQNVDKFKGIIFAVDLPDFQYKVLEASQKQPILVDFWADWCAPCHAIVPSLNRVMQYYAGQLKLAKLEVDKDDNMTLAGRYQVRGFPSVLLFRNGQEVARFSGAKPVQFIVDFIETHALLP